MKSLSDYITETLSTEDGAGAWIHDFVHSENLKFAGKSKAKRRQMALAAYYAKLKEEAEPLVEAATGPGIYHCTNPKCKVIKISGVPRAGHLVEKEFKNWSPLMGPKGVAQATPGCISCNKPMAFKRPLNEEVEDLQESRAELLGHLAKLGFSKDSYENQGGAHAYWLKGANKVSTQDIHDHLKKQGYEVSHFTPPKGFEHMGTSVSGKRKEKSGHAFLKHGFSIEPQGGNSLHVRFHKTRRDSLGIDEAYDQKMMDKAHNLAGRGMAKFKLPSKAPKASEPERRKALHAAALAQQALSGKFHVEQVEVDEAFDREAHYNMMLHKRKAKEVSDKIDKIVLNGGQVGLGDPLTHQLYHHRTKAKNWQKIGGFDNQGMGEDVELVEGWMKHSDGTFSAEASDIAGHTMGKKPQVVHCPKCKSPQWSATLLGAHPAVKHRDAEGEVTHWTHACKCGAKMTVFNDDVQDGEGDAIMEDDLHSAFKSYDYWHEMSDDGRAYDKGRAQKKNIRELIKKHNVSQEAGKAMWDKIRDTKYHPYPAKDFHEDVARAELKILEEELAATESMLGAERKKNEPKKKSVVGSAVLKKYLKLKRKIMAMKTEFSQWA